MREKRVDADDELPEDMRIHHDVLRGLVLLRAPAELMRLQGIRVRTLHSREPQEDVPVAHLHQAFRYGININPTDLPVRELQAILVWINERLG